jgi:hypothetical protein
MTVMKTNVPEETVDGEDLPREDPPLESQAMIPGQAHLPFRSSFKTLLDKTREQDAANLQLERDVLAGRG